MNLPSCPIVNTINVHDIHSNEEFPTVVGHDNNNIGNVQVVYHKEPKNPLATNVEVVHEDAYVTKMHLENL
jgi:hypothetical protein